MRKNMTILVGAAFAVLTTGSALAAYCGDCGLSKTEAAVTAERLAGCGSGHDRVKRPGDDSTSTKESSV